MLISPEYAALNALLHQTDLGYGNHLYNEAEYVALCEAYSTTDILDYGCGKGGLAASLSWPIKEYDPAIPGKDTSAEPADIVVCHDVLEHIEPEFLDNVLADLARCVKIIGYFTIAMGPSLDILSDGRNAHLSQHPCEWWRSHLSSYFEVALIRERTYIGYKYNIQFIGLTDIAVYVKSFHRLG